MDKVIAFERHGRATVLESSVMAAVVSVKPESKLKVFIGPQRSRMVKKGDNIEKYVSPAIKALMTKANAAEKIEGSGT